MKNIFGEALKQIMKDKGKDHARKFIMDTFDKSFEKIEQFNLEEFIKSFGQDNITSRVIKTLHADNMYTYEIEVPGIPKQNLKVNFDQGVLTIKSDSDIRKIDIELTVDKDDQIITSKLELGILSIKFQTPSQPNKNTEVNID